MFQFSLIDIIIFFLLFWHKTHEKQFDSIITVSTLTLIQRLRQFTCPEIAVFFTSSFRAFFLFFTYAKVSAFSHLKALISARVSKKKRKEKNRYFGTCKPAYVIYQRAEFIQATVSCSLP